MAPRTGKRSQTSTSTSKRVNFVLKNVDIGYINAIRRTIIGNLTSVAPSFDSYHPEYNDFTFHINKTSLHNEFMGHRLSLVPMHFTAEEIDAFDPNQYRFEINVHNTSQEMLDVTSKDIIIYDMNGKQVDERLRNRIFPPDPISKDYILITVLKPNFYDPKNGEQLHVTYKARKGTGMENARWSCVSQCSHFYNVDEAKSEAARETAGATKAAWDTLEKFKHFITNDKNEPSSVSFILETINQTHEPMTYWGRAIDTLVNEVDELRKARTQRVTFKSTEDISEISVKGIDDTIGNLMQVVAFNHYYRVPEEDQRLSYIGYYKTHPLEKEVIFKIKFTSKEEDMHRFFDLWTTAVNEVIETLRTAPQDVVYA